MIFSSGLKLSTALLDKSQYGSTGLSTGMRYGLAPFLSRDDERCSEEKLDMFMSDVIIPLAAQTNAVVLCTAVRDDCALSTSFLRMYSVARAKWSILSQRSIGRRRCDATCTDLWR